MFRLKVLVLAVFVVALGAVAAPAMGKTVYGSNGCGTSEYEPKIMAFTCGDGKVRFERPGWTRWDGEVATATGVLRHPDIDDPVCAKTTILACPWVEAAATLEMWRPVYCASNGRWQFTRLRVLSPEDVDPNLREVTRDYKCSEYSRPSKPDKPQRKFFLGTSYAASLMREALGRRDGLAFIAGYNRDVRCNKRLARDRVRCRMSWIVGDSYFSGVGSIWITYPSSGPYWNFSYRIKSRNAYCESTGGSRCKRTYVAR